MCLQTKTWQVEQLQSDAAQQAAAFQVKLQQHTKDAHADTSALQEQLAAAREQADTAQQQVDSLQADLIASRSQLEAMQQQNGKLLTNLAAAQREAGEAGRQLRQARADAEQLRVQSGAAAGASQQAQHSMQAQHAQTVKELRCATVFAVWWL